MSNDYKDSMNLPVTDFPMRAGLAKSEPLRLKKWYDMDLYHEVLKANAGHESYILHDGPPYANGPIHIGHAFNKIAKDIIVKFRSQQGFYSPYIPGWDCHGQPIEHIVEERLGPQKMAAIDRATLRRLCRDWATKNIDIQRDGFKRLGVIGDWDNPYLTYLPAYEAGNVRVFQMLYDKGSIYRGRKPIHWCRHCHTALAEAEIEYADEPSPSAYVAFDLTSEANALLQRLFHLPDGLPAAVLIWTTTPWTLPANTAVSLNPEAEYIAVEKDGRALVFAHELHDAVAAAAGWDEGDSPGQPPRLLSDANGEPVRVRGRELQGLTYHHPIHEGMTCVIVTGDHVTLEAGTGAVHTAPGHGQDDYLVGEAFDLPMLMPVDDNGVFDAGGGPFAGLDVDGANPVILDWLEERGALVARQKIVHSYPHCWRCHEPVIFRATEQWFVTMDGTGLRQTALDELAKLNWYPNWAENRLRAMIETRPDWCISRQRAWGVPVPVFHCRQCGSPVANDATFEAVIRLFEEEGADAWFTRDPAEYLPADTHCEQCGGTELDPCPDILDVWWESGSSHTSVLEPRPELARPADLYLEGSDQHRGWFQSSLLTSVGAYGVAPYRGIMSCGFTVDEEGRKMSKSLGNGVDPAEVFEKFGADVLRLWVGSVDTAQDVSISDNILERTADAYRRFRNTFRYLLSNLADFDPATDLVAADQLARIDAWAICRLAAVIGDVAAGYEGYRFHLAFRALYDYVATDLSAVYLDVLKDRLYSEAPKSLARRSAQTVLYQILEFMVRDLAPILSFTCDEVWEYYPKALRGEDHAPAVALAGWFREADLRPSLPDALAVELQTEYAAAMQARAIVTKALEEARNNKVIGKSQEAAVELRLPADEVAVLRALPAGTLEEFFIVAAVELQESSEAEALITEAAGQKCPRCWNIRSLGADPHHADVCGRCAAVLTELGI